MSSELLNGFSQTIRSRKVKEFSQPLRSLAKGVSVEDLCEISVEECRDLDGVETEIGRPDALRPVETALSRVEFTFKRLRESNTGACHQGVLFVEALLESVQLHHPVR